MSSCFGRPLPKAAQHNQGATAIIVRSRSQPAGPAPSCLGPRVCSAGRPPTLTPATAHRGRTRPGKCSTSSGVVSGARSRSDDISDQ
eukprot:scaffold114214_cov30-Tisochrysis_lutea.AAC.3